MMDISIKKMHEKAQLPEYQTDHSAGMDVSACLDAPVTLSPMERKMIPTGLAIAIPEGYEGQIRSRSGMSLKLGIVVVNGVGTIDADYRGEVGVLMVNLSSEKYTINDGDRIAQLVIAAYAKASWQEVSDLDDTVRGSGGVGSTGFSAVQQ